MKGEHNLETLVCRRRDGVFYVEAVDGRVVGGPYLSKDDGLRGLLHAVAEMRGSSA